ncbi:hypothetical protein JCM19233_2783 [Vibrio astriarenae]|nr:hypothetical protein JCM19233_2783 [Vibrio sp. C7]
MAPALWVPLRSSILRKASTLLTPKNEVNVLDDKEFEHT